LLSPEASILSEGLAPFSSVLDRNSVASVVSSEAVLTAVEAGSSVDFFSL